MTKNKYDSWRKRTKRQLEYTKTDCKKAHRMLNIAMNGLRKMDFFYNNCGACEDNHNIICKVFDQIERIAGSE